MGKLHNIVNVDNVETQKFDWGILQWLSEPRVTGADHMVTGIVTLEPGKGHARHNHPDCAEVLYVLEGSGEQGIYDDDDKLTTTRVTKGDLIYLKPSQFHSTINTGKDKMVILAVYQFTGPEAAMRADPAVTLIAAPKPL
ncbi:MAG: cupin domain-containing protein [Methylobacteriaceae bacterium]|jgi:oxalate decarboxylase/phosphoglucose isomerase-like protein (cupin superfamily)|nr:cupin domain-containing protein [Methylobacteriaceae bacterium]